jgi:hypothetical protein
MFTTYKNGAEQEAETVTRYELGAEVEADGVYTVKNGAEEEVWSAIKVLKELSNTFDNGALYIQESGLKFWYTKDEDYFDGKQYGDISGSGDITFYFEGEWTNPTISFDYEGGGVRSNASMSTWYTMNAGDISIYSRTTSGTETTTEVVSNVGTSLSGADIDISLEKGSYSTTLTGTFNRLGISIHVTGYNSVTPFYSATIDMKVSNLQFNSTKIAFPESAEFDYT